MSFEGYWSNGKKHGPGLLKVLVQTDNETTDTLDSNTTEHVFFEVWSKGNRQHRELLQCQGYDVPVMAELPQYHKWKYVWEHSEGQSNGHHEVNVLENTGNVNTAIPVRDNITTSNLLVPYSDEQEEGQNHFHTHTNFNVLDQGDVDDYPDRHYSVDFYASTPQVHSKSCNKPRSSSFSSYLNSRSGYFLQSRRNRFGIKKCHQSGRGGYIVILSAIRKKAKLSKVFSLK